MLKHLRPAFALVALMTVVAGLLYPLAINGVASVLLPAQAHGSLVERDGVVIGSSLIGQSFTSERYFWSRPSATGPDVYNASASGGSNLGPTSAKLRDRVAADIAHLRASGIAGPVPADAATASGSGLDPHVSPEFVRLQIARIASARGLQATDVAALVERFIEARALGFIGEPRVNVLNLNLALDRMKT